MNIIDVHKKLRQDACSMADMLATLKWVEGHYDFAKGMGFWEVKIYEALITSTRAGRTSSTATSARCWHGRYSSLEGGVSSRQGGAADRVGEGQLSRLDAIGQRRQSAAAGQQARVRHAAADRD
eukprot:6204864-Pleurochrysis_carterae.AAC.1